MEDGRLQKSNILLRKQMSCGGQVEHRIDAIQAAVEARRADVFVGTNRTGIFPLIAEPRDSARLMCGLCINRK